MMNHHIIKNMILKSICTSTLCIAAFTAANAEEISKAEQQKHAQVCKGKSQGDMISFAYKGVTFNGTCETDANGKLTFQPPMPASDAKVNMQSEMSETQSDPRPISPPTVITPPPQTSETPRPMMDPMPIPTVPSSKQPSNSPIDQP